MRRSITTRPMTTKANFVASYIPLTEFSLPFYPIWCGRLPLLESAFFLNAQWSLSLLHYSQAIMLLPTSNQIKYKISRCRFLSRSLVFDSNDISNGIQMSISSALSLSLLADAAKCSCSTGTVIIYLEKYFVCFLNDRFSCNEICSACFSFI